MHYSSEIQQAAKDFYDAFVEEHNGEQPDAGQLIEGLRSDAYFIEGYVADVLLYELCDDRDA